MSKDLNSGDLEMAVVIASRREPQQTEVPPVMVTEGAFSGLAEETGGNDGKVEKWKAAKPSAAGLQAPANMDARTRAPRTMGR